MCRWGGGGGGAGLGNCGTVEEMKVKVRREYTSHVKKVLRYNVKGANINICAASVLT